MRFNRIASLVTFTLSLSVAFPSNAQTDEEKAAARALAIQGATALQENKFAEAIDLITRAEAVVHAPPHLLMIGRAQVGLGRLVAARESFLKVIREQLPVTAPAAFKKAQQDAKTDLEAIEPRIGSLRIALTGPGAGDPSKVTVKLDDQPVTTALIGVHRPIDPGKHVVTAYVTGRSPVSQEVSLGDGEKKEIELSVETPATLVPDETPDETPKPPPPPPPSGMSPLRIAGIAGMGVGAAGLIVGGVFLGLQASKQSEANTLFDTCKAQPGGCTQAERDDVGALDQAAATRGTIGIASLIGGAVLAGGGVALFLIGGKKSQPKPTNGFVMPYVTPNGGGLVGRF